MSGWPNSCRLSSGGFAAAKRGIEVTGVEIDVEGEFGAEGEPARNVVYRAIVRAKATPQEIRDLMIHTDRVAEILNTLRISTPVTLVELQVEPD